MPAPHEYLRELASRNYASYLATGHWRALRRDALERAGRRCTSCGFDPQGMIDLLEVHQRTYERLGCEQPDDLVVLCRACHAGEHPDKPRPNVVLGPDPAWSDD